MSPLIDNRALIIGVGNLDRGDDAFGPACIDFLKYRYPQMAVFHKETDDLTRLIALWERKDVIVVDAFQSNEGSIGDLLITDDLDSWQGSLVGSFSTHGLSLIAVWKLAGTVSKLPRSIFLIGVKGQRWDIGSPMSSSVKLAMDKVACEILKRVATS